MTTGKNRREEALAAIADLRSIKLTPYEQEVLDGFEDFRRKHPFSLRSLREDELPSRRS
jgi:hypothetical protein